MMLMSLLHSLAALWMHVIFQGFFQHIGKFLMKQLEKEKNLFLFLVKWLHVPSLYWIDLTDAVSQWLI